MKLLELITKLAYNETLNPKLWNEFTLNEKVRNHLMTVANKFATTLKIEDSAIVDYVLTGSNANYNWTELSDVDIHLIVDYDKLGCECTVDIEDCLLAKKSLWNDRHDITTYGHPVELYASDVKDQLVQDSGCYSILRNQWIKKPVRRSVVIDELLISKKAEEIAKEIDNLISSETTDEESIQEITDRLWKYRQSGLQKGGEFSIENLVFKALRNNGYVDKIRSYSVRADDKSMSLEEAFTSKPNYEVTTATSSVFKTLQKIGNRFIRFTAFIRDDEAEVEFAESVDGMPPSMFKRDRYDTTGSGNANAVMSMVGHSLKELIDRYTPQMIVFTAEREKNATDVGKRGRVYEAMFKKFAPSYEITSRISGSTTYYRLYYNETSK